MRAEAKLLISLIIESLYDNVERLETEIVHNQQEDPYVVPHLISVQASLRESLRLAEGCLVEVQDEGSPVGSG
jgi:hypothetical protein